MKDNSIRSKIALAVFGVIALSSLVNAWSDYLQLNLLEDYMAEAFPSEEDWAANDLRMGVLGMAHFVVLLGTVFAFLYWFRRAYANLEAIGVRIKRNNNMAVWGFIIPFLNLVRPVQIAMEIVSKSRKKLRELGSGFQSTGIEVVVVLWWACYLATNITANISFRLMMQEDTSIMKLIESTRFSMVSSVVDFFAALVTMAMIFVVSRQEQALAEAVAHQELDPVADDPGDEQAMDGILPA